MRIRALTLWEPWATLILLGLKRFETRSWRAPAGAVGGRIAIHAGKRFDREAWASHIAPVLHLHKVNYLEVAKKAQWNRGHVVCTARLAECVFMERGMIDSLSGLERALGDWSPGRAAWRLEEVRPVEPPVQAGGAQGLWWWDAPEGVS